MHVSLYKNQSPPNKVNKKITGEKEFTGVIFTERDTLDILNPTIVVKMSNEASDVSKYNYMFINKFNRYYYIDSISAEGGLWRIVGRVDPLMSHKKDILESKQYVIRQETNNNSPYLDDNMLPISSQHNYVGKEFGRNVADITCGRIILATTGKGGTPI